MCLGRGWQERLQWGRLLGAVAWALHQQSGLGPCSVLGRRGHIYLQELRRGAGDCQAGLGSRSECRVARLGRQVDMEKGLDPGGSLKEGPTGFPD